MGDGRRHDGGGDDGRVSLEHLDGPLVLVFLRGPGGPDVHLFVFAAANHILDVVAEGCSDLATRVLASFQLEFEAFVTKIVNPNSGVVGCDDQLDFSVRIVGRIVDGFDACDFTAFGVLAVGRPDMHLSLKLQTFRLVKVAQSREAPRDGSLTIGCERHGRNDVRHLAPIRDTLVWYAPETEFGVQGTRQEESVVSGVKLNRCHKIAMLEAAKTFIPARMPQPDRSIHR